MTTQTTSRLNFIPKPQVAEFVHVDYYDANGVGYSNITGKPSIPRGTKPLQNEKYINWTDDLNLPFVKNSPVDPEVARGRKLAQGFDDYITDLNNQEKTRKFYETRTGFQKVDNRTVWSTPNSTTFTPYDQYGNIIATKNVLPESDLSAIVHPITPETKLPDIQPRNPDMPQMPTKLRINNEVPIPFQNVRSVDIPSFNQRRVASEPMSFVKSLPVLNTITPDQGGSAPVFQQGYNIPMYGTGKGYLKKEQRVRSVFEPENKGLESLPQPSTSGTKSKSSTKVVLKGNKNDVLPAKVDENDENKKVFIPKENLNYNPSTRGKRLKNPNYYDKIIIAETDPLSNKIYIPENKLLYTESTINQRRLPLSSNNVAGKRRKHSIKKK